MDSDDLYFSPFRIFDMPEEKNLLHKWKKHFTNLKIGVEVRYLTKNKKKIELLVNKKEHEERLAIPLLGRTTDEQE